MINIPTLRLRSVTVELKELTIKESLSLSVIPAGNFELSTTSFIKKALADANSEIDPLKLSVEDRMMIVAHYIASSNDGNPDFAIGRANFSDYLIGDEKKRVSSIDVGEISGDYWQVRTLTGEYAESIERTLGATDLPNRVHWIIGRMACQLVRAEDDFSFDDIDLWLINRIAIFSSFPESDFASLFFAYNQARKELNHLFLIDSDDEGLIALPKEEYSSLGAARFPVFTCISRLVKSMA